MKNLNESEFRSPKWLRKYLDFEIVTGKDVNPEAKAKRKLIEDEEIKREEDQKLALKKWLLQWDKMMASDGWNRSYFKKFLKNKGLINDEYIYQSELDAVKKVCQKMKYYTLFDEFEIWQKEKVKADIDEKFKKQEEKLKKEQEDRRRQEEFYDQKRKKDKEQYEISKELEGTY